jgi:hypothetical protein
MAQPCLPQTRSAITVVRMNSLPSFLSEMRDDGSCVRHNDPEHDAAEHAYDPFSAHQPTPLYTVRTENGDRHWHTDSAQHAREQHDLAFAGESGETIQEVFAGQPAAQPQSGR